MKKAYRILAILLCLSMLFALAACSAKQETTTEDQQPGETTTETTGTAEPSGDAPASEETPEEMTLSVAWWGGAARNERIEKTLDLYSELNPNVSFSTATNNFSDHYTAMATAAASSDLPDMWLLSASLWLNQFAGSNQLLDLTPYIESGALDVSQIPETILESGRANDGKIYAIGAGYSGPAMQYNKTALEAAGITVEDGMTIEDFCKKCAEIYEKTGLQTVINNPEMFIEYLLRADGKLLYDDGRLGADSPEDLLPYFELMERGRSEGWLIDYETWVSAGGDSAQQPIVTGATWNCMWNANQLPLVQGPCPDGVELDLITWPTSDLAKSNYMLANMVWGIGINTEHPDEAVALLNWWINSIDAQKIMLGEMGVPLNAEAAAAVTPELDESTKKVFNYELDVVVPESSKANPTGGNGAAEVRALIDELEEGMYYGSIGAEEAAERLFTEGNALMAAGKA